VRRPRSDWSAEAPMMATLSGDSSGRRSGMSIRTFQNQKTTLYRKGREGCAKDAKEIFLIQSIPRGGADGYSQ
jgi:hypothetical protein